MVIKRTMVSFAVCFIIIGIFTSCGSVGMLPGIVFTKPYMHRIEEGIEEKLVTALSNQDIDAFRALFGYSATKQGSFLQDTQTIMDFYGGEVISFKVHTPGEKSQKRGKMFRVFTIPQIDVERVSDKYTIYLYYESITTEMPEELGIHHLRILLDGTSHDRSFGTNGYKTLEDELYN